MIFEPYTYEILTKFSKGGEEELRSIESIARTCYKSQNSECIGDTAKFVDGLIRRGHLAMLEHGSISVKIICDRCISHEIVRHRMASFAQESTRWCNYAKDRFGAEIRFITPDLSDADDPEQARLHFDMAAKVCESCYMYLVNEQHVAPQRARRILPHALKTEIVVTANYREWMHILELRTKPDCDPQMQKLMTDLLDSLKEQLPVVFDRVGYWNVNN